MIIETKYPDVAPTYGKLWRGRERAIEQLFGTWEESYTLLLQILEAIAQTTPGIKFKILTCDTSDNNVKIFKSIVWAYGPCIAAFKHLRPVITVILNNFFNFIILQNLIEFNNMFLRFNCRILRSFKGMKKK
jgi:hypothetical protein